MEIVNVKIEELKPADYNPRQMTESQAATLTESLKKFGLVDPLIVNKHPGRENIVVGGHQRLKIAKSLGFSEIPVVYVDLDEALEKELNIRLNKNLGEWDFDLLANFDLDLLKAIGFSERDLHLLTPDNEVVLPDLEGDDVKMKQISIYYEAALNTSKTSSITAEPGSNISEKVLNFVRKHKNCQNGNQGL